MGDSNLRRSCDVSLILYYLGGLRSTRTVGFWRPCCLFPSVQIKELALGCTTAPFCQNTRVERHREDTLLNSIVGQQPYFKNVY